MHLIVLNSRRSRIVSLVLPWWSACHVACYSVSDRPSMASRQGIKCCAGSYQSARATTRTRNSSSGKCLPYDDNDKRQTTNIQTAVDIIKCGARSGSPQLASFSTNVYQSCTQKCSFSNFSSCYVCVHLYANPNNLWLYQGNQNKY